MTSSRNFLTLGIDATNLRGGGGVTHLVELLRVASPLEAGFKCIVVWGGRSTLDYLEERPWLIKRNPDELNKGLLRRSFWQRYHLSQAALDENCDVLFVPGGAYAGNFHPVVTMSQNLLPFDLVELRRYEWTLLRFKLHALRFIHTRSFRKSDGVVFLTKYARNAVSSVAGNLSGISCIIPHGLSTRFNRAPRIQRSIVEYDDENPFRILYVSTIDNYKHQWVVVRAIAALRNKGFPVALDLIGSAYPPALRRLNEEIDVCDPTLMWIRYHGEVPFSELHLRYIQADLGLFASSCENMPNILLEKMASGLPVACSDRGPMPEVLGDSGAYFDPENADDISRVLSDLISSPTLRAKLANSSYERSGKFSWLTCSDDTLAFLRRVCLSEENH